MKIFSVIFICLVFGADISAETWHVPGDWPTIQRAIEESDDYDTIVVAPGIYKERIDFLGKSIVVMSNYGPHQTAIDGMRGGSVVSFKNGEDDDSALDGFTIFNGLASWGGGVHCIDASPIIKNNTIQDNIAGHGGGIYCGEYAEPEILDNHIAGNSVTVAGAGIACHNATPLISDNTITANFGDGIFSALDAVEIHNNDISFNQGAGITLNDSWGEVHGNLISSNDESGLYLVMSDVEVANCIIDQNQRSGIYCDLCDSYPPYIINCTLSMNLADKGGGIFCRDSKPTVVNTILWDDLAPEGSEIYVESLFSFSVLTISYCDLDGGMSGVMIDGGSTLNWGAGMINEVPAFTHVGFRDYHITFNSPCRDAGDNSASGLTGKDVEGDPRIASGIVDIGADEFYRHLYFTGDLTPGGTAQANFIGEPGSQPVGLWFSVSVLDPPLSTRLGDWYLAPPIIGPVVLAPIPPNGLQTLNETIPLLPQAPYDVPMQGFIKNRFTNLSIIEVR